MYEVTRLGTTLFVRAETPLMRKDEAAELCGAIGEEARATAEPVGLLMDLAALTRVTPAAGLYAMKRLRELPIGRVALVGGNAFVRAMARGVLSLARFPDHAFFRDADEARQWLEGADGRSAR